MSSLNLKVRVKNGEITPQEALKQLAMSSDNVEAALKSRTAKWLDSPNAERRYKQAVNAEQRKQ